MAAIAPLRILSSTVLRAVAYDERSQELRVRFMTGAVYRYFAVPPEIADELVHPPGNSHGRYFNDQIRDSYEYQEDR